MTGTLLRTGNLKEFHPLGAVGNPVYLSASQLQSALRRRLGAPVADILAIPQRNEDGDTIDWYAPLSGPVVPWSAATPQERTQAKAELLRIREQIQETGAAMRGEENSERQIFGQLLDLVTTFPNDSHVYLVDGRPVITFWGFQEMNAPANSDPLLTLPEADESPAPPPPVTETPEAPADQPEEPKGRRFPWWWLLALLLLILLLLLALKMCGEEKVEAPAPESPPTEETTKQPSPEEGQPVPEEEKPPVDEPAEPKPESEPRRVIDQIRDVDVVRDQVIVDKTIDGEATGVIGPDQVVEETVADGVATEGTADALEAVPGEEIPAAAEDIPATEAIDTGEAPTDEAPGESPQDGREPIPPEEKTTQENAPEAPEKGPQEDPEKAPQEATDKDPRKGLEDGSQEGAEKDNPKIDPNAQTPTPDRPGSADAENKPQGPPLQIPKDALKSGSTEFLDGRWSSSTSLMDSHTGRPIELEYAFQGGAGTVSLKRDGVVCKGKTGAAIKNGKLVISDTGNITCPDGAQYRGARVECRIDEQGRADCSGGYPSGDRFSTKIRKSEPTPAE